MIIGLSRQAECDGESENLYRGGGGGEGYFRSTYLLVSYFPFTVHMAIYFPFTVLGVAYVHRSQKLLFHDHSSHGARPYSPFSSVTRMIKNIGILEIILTYVVSPS